MQLLQMGPDLNHIDLYDSATVGAFIDCVRTWPTNLARLQVLNPSSVAFFFFFLMIQPNGF